MNELSPESCIVCGNSNFECSDGFFYCGVCNSQSQTLREEVADDSACNFINIGRIRTNEEDIAYPKVLSKELYYGALTEVYLEMVSFTEERIDCLEFSQLAIQIWATYLMKFGIAFKKQESSDKKIVDMCPDISHYFDGSTDDTDDDFTITEKVFDRTLNRLKRRKKITTPEDSTSNNVDSSIGGTLDKVFEEDQMNECIPENDDGNECSAGIDELSFKEVGVELPTESHEPKERDNINHFNLTVLVSCIYLSLLLLRQEVELSDIIRWIREGHFPFYRAHKLIRKTELGSLKVKELDFPALQPIVHKIVRENTCQIMRTLNIASLPSKNLMPLVERYVYSLQLPKEFSEIVKSLCLLHSGSTHVDFIMKVNENRKSFQFHSPEGRAMALILVSLKMIFGLDDSSERHLSHHALWIKQKLTCIGLHDEAANIFVWNDWLQYLLFRHEIVKKVNPHFLATNSSGDFDNYDFELVRSFLSSKDGPVKLDEKETRYYIEDYKNFLYLDPQSAFSDVTCDCEPSKNPDVDIFLYLFDNNSKCISNLNEGLKAVLLDNYHKKNIDFIMRPSKYSNFLLQSGIEITVSETLSRKECKLSQVTLNPIRNLSENPTMIEIKHGSKSDKLVFDVEPTTTHVNCVNHDEELDSVPIELDCKMLIQPWKSYWLYMDKNASEALLKNKRLIDYYLARENLPITFCKLLDTFAKMIDISPPELLKSVINTEIQMLSYLVTDECMDEYHIFKKQLYTDNTW